jgi:MFS family permease
MTASPPIAPRGIVLGLFIFAGPALRTSLLGSLLVSEAAIGRAYGLSDPGLAILMESIVCGALLSTLLLRFLADRFGALRLSLGSAVAVLMILAVTMLAGQALVPGAVTTAFLFGSAGLLGFASAVLATITQVLLGKASEPDSHDREVLQSIWSAGQPAGFIVGSVAGGLLVKLVDWWAAYALTAILALLVLVSLCTNQRLRGLLVSGEARREEAQRPHWDSLLWLLATIAAFEVWSTFGSLVSWTSLITNMALVGILITGTLALRDLRRPDRIHAISVEPFAAAGFAGGVVVLLLLQLPTTAEFEVLLLSTLTNASPELLGDRSAFGNVGQILGTSLAGVLIYHGRARLALLGGLVLLLLGLLAYIAYPWVHGLVFVYSSRFMAGLGAGLATPTLFLFALARVRSDLSTPAGTWLVLVLIGSTELGLALLDLVLSAATAMTGSVFWGFVVVEAAQAGFGLVVLAAAWLVVRFEAAGESGPHATDRHIDGTPAGSAALGAPASGRRLLR